MSRKTRKPVSISEHYEIAEAIREAEEALLNLLSFGRYFDSGEIQGLTTSFKRLGRVKNRLDNDLFLSYPNLPREWSAFYYGEQEESDELFKEAESFEDYQ